MTDEADTSERANDLVAATSGAERHTIRLRGPWQFEACAETSPRTGRQHLPGILSAALGEAFRGAVIYRRPFNRPPLAEGERLWLIVARAGPAVEVSLNGQLLGSIAAGAMGRFEIGALARPHNELLVRYEVVDPARSASGEVALEIEPAAG